MKKLIVALHGNPGHVSDFDAVFDKFGIDKEIETVIHQRPAGGADIDSLIADLERTLTTLPKSEITVLAYSWGCYLACRWFARCNFDIARVIFISPTLIAENPISSSALTLTRMPVLGNLLMRKITPKKSSEFIQKSFYPHTPSLQQHAGLYKKLNNPVLWKGAISYKHQQQHSGLMDLKIPDAADVVVVRGELDASVNWPLQENALRSLIQNWDNAAIHVIKKAGHALPWTEPTQLAGILRSAIRANELTARTGLESRSRQDRHNVVSMLQHHAQTSPQKIALRWVRPDELKTFNGYVSTKFGTREINYYDFYQLIGHLAKGLTDIGVRPGDRVILFLPMSLEMYVAMFAIQHLGAIAVFLDSWARRNQLGASAKCVSPRAIISHKRAFDAVAGIADLDKIPLRIIAGPGYDGTFTAQLESLLATRGSAPITAVKADDTALITFTTGSSGDPKGANRTHRFLYAQHAALKDVVPYYSQDSDIPAFPIFSLNNLASGVTTLLPAIDLAQPHHYDAAALASQILHEKVTCTTLSPSMLNSLSGFCQRNNIKLESLRRVITGGAPISRDDVSAFRAIAPAAEIWILYGSTEVEPMAHIEATEMLALDTSHDAEIVEEGVNVGRIAHGLRYKFIRPCKDDIDSKNLNWREWEVEEHEVGEFIVSGDHVCANYYNNELAFQRTKIREKDGTVWHRTGDLARLDERGYLWIVGRVHNMVRRQDQNYFPVKAEIVLNRCVFVKKGAFLGIADARLGERTAVVVELVSGHKDRLVCINEIMRLFQKNKIIVDSLYAVDAIPMDPRHHSKVEYSLLRKKIHAENIKDLLACKNDLMEKDHALVHDSI